MSTSALIGRSPIAVSRRCSHSGEGPFLTPRTRRSAKAGQSEGVAPNSSDTVTGHGNLPSTGFGVFSLYLPMSAADRSRAMPLHAGAVGAVGREVDLDHRIVEAHPLGVVGAERRIGGQVDDALVVVGDLQLELGHQHAAAFDAADFADAQRHILARDVGAGRHEHAHHAGARVGRAAYDLHGVARTGVDHADAQPVGVGMLLGRDHARDGEGRQRLALVGDALDLKPDHGELVGDLVERLVGVEVLLEPGEGEFHWQLPEIHRRQRDEETNGDDGRCAYTKFVKFAPH